MLRGAFRPPKPGNRVCCDAHWVVGVQVFKHWLSCSCMAAEKLDVDAGHGKPPGAGGKAPHSMGKIAPPGSFDSAHKFLCYATGMRGASLRMTILFGGEKPQVHYAALRSGWQICLKSKDSRESHESRAEGSSHADPFRLVSDYSLDCDLLSIATMPSTTRPAAQIASITSEVEIKSWATR
jgi:hypothetical protein